MSIDLDSQRFNPQGNMSNVGFPQGGQGGQGNIGQQFDGAISRNGNAGQFNNFSSNQSGRNGNAGQSGQFNTFSKNQSSNNVPPPPPSFSEGSQSAQGNQQAQGFPPAPPSVPDEALEALSDSVTDDMSYSDFQTLLNDTAEEYGIPAGALSAAFFSENSSAS